MNDPQWSDRPDIKVHLPYVLASSPEALGVSKEGVHVFANPAYLKLFGYSSMEELAGRPILDLIAPVSHGVVSDYIRRRIEGKDIPRDYQVRGRRKDGSDFPMEVHATRYTLDGQVFTNVVLRDLTERDAAERALRESEEKFHVIAEQTAAGVAILQDGKVVYANRGACVITDSTEAEMLTWGDAKFASLVHPDDLASVVAQNTGRGPPDAHARGGYTYRLVTAQGKVTWVEQYARAVLYRGRPATLVTVLDIDARKQAETQRAGLENALNQAERLEAVGRLAGGVAHDFNNLLTGILGNVELALVDLPKDHGVRRFLDEANRAAAQAADLTKDLLAFSRKQPIQPRVVDLNELVLRMDRMVGRSLSEDIQRDTSLSPGVLAVKVDPSQMEQVVVNLVLNARDAMPKGGHVRIGTSLVELTPQDVASRPDLTAGRYARLSVKDNGTGLAPEVRGHLFEPFFTTKERGRGTGLGLATSFGAVRQNNGTIEVESEPGKGTTFHVYLPLQTAAPQPLVVAPVNGRPRGSETVLLVEDEPGVLHLAEHILTRQGYRVLSFTQGAQALTAAEAFEGAVHVLITDVVMPGMHGAELARALRVRRPELRVLFMSGYAEDVVATRGAVDLGTNFLAKPFTLTDLAVKVRSVLDQGKPR